MKDVAKGDYARLLADVKRLERQKGELLAAFRKQASQTYCMCYRPAECAPK